MAALRARGLACDTDYAGRSKKGQLTQASRLGARTTVIVDADGARIVRPGGDEPTSLEQLAATLGGPSTRVAPSRSPAGRRAAATTAASSSSTCATRRA